LSGLLAADKVSCVADYTVAEPLLRFQLAPAEPVRFDFLDAETSWQSAGSTSLC
jgi:hypothetical protein